MKTDKTFKINKQVKRLMCSFTDNAKKHAFKNMMIEAQVMGERVIEKKKKKNGLTVDDSDDE